MEKDNKQNRPNNIPIGKKPFNSKTDSKPMALSEAKTTGLKSAIFSAFLETSNGCGYITVVEDYHEQNGKKGIYWVKRPFSMHILLAAKGDLTVKYNNIEYWVVFYEAINEQKLLQYIQPTKFFNSAASPQNIYVFSHKHISHFENDNYESVTAFVPCQNSTEPVLVNVFYEKSSQMYFINETTYETIRQRYGLPYLRIKSAQLAEGNSFEELRAHSELNLLGYNVGSAAGNTSQRRQRLLKDIMDSGLLSKSEIISHLEWLVNTREYMTNMQNAVRDWQKDLQFVRNYNINQQRKIWANCFILK